MSVSKSQAHLLRAAWASASQAKSAATSDHERKMAEAFEYLVMALVRDSEKS